MSTTCTVKFRYTGGGYTARAGRGKKAVSASSTNQPAMACSRAAAKFFHCNEDLVRLDPKPGVMESTGECTATELPAPKGDIELTPAEFSALEFIAKYGPGEWVDVVSPQLARLLTEIEKACPDLLGLITNPRADACGMKPFLRATVTTVGREFIARTKGGA